MTKLIGYGQSTVLIFYTRNASNLKYMYSDMVPYGQKSGRMDEGKDRRCPQMSLGGKK